MANSIKKVKYEVKDLEIHLDKKGWFVEMIKRKEIGCDIKQVSVASIKPGETRGNHYHLNKTEWFIIIGGRAELYLTNPKTKEKVCFNLSFEKPKVITVFPKIAHAIKNIDKKTIYFVEADSAIYNHKKPDSIPCPIC